MARVGVAIHQARQNDHAPGVDFRFEWSGRGEGGVRVDCHDAIASNRDGPVFDDAALAVQGDDRAVLDEDIRHQRLRLMRGPRGADCFVALDFAPWARAS